MKRRGFLKALSVALAAPTSLIAAPLSSITVEALKPIVKKGRGMGSCITYYDELAFYPINVDPSRVLYCLTMPTTL